MSQHNISNPLQACTEIFIRPNAVFATLLHKQNWAWVPFFIVCLMVVLPTQVYLNFVDFDWYREILVDMQAGDKSPAEQDAMRSGMTLGAVKLFGSVFPIIGLILMNAIFALYLHLVTRSDEENINGFMDWYGFTWWASLPLVIAGLISISIVLLSTNPQLSPTELSPTTLAYWLDLSMSDPWFNLTTSIRLESFLSIYFIAVGIGQWTRLGGRKALILAALPYLVIWLVMAFFAMG